MIFTGICKCSICIQLISTPYKQGTPECLWFFISNKIEEILIYGQLAGDHFMEVTAATTFNSFSKSVMLNIIHWSYMWAQM